MTDALRVSPQDVTHKLSADLDKTEAQAWIDKTYMPIAETIKHRSIVARYVEGQRWEDTELFTRIYRRRFEEGQEVRGCETYEGLLTQYYTRVDHMFADMRRYGYREDADDLIPVVISPDGNLVIGNQGNHRLAMAQVLKVPTVAVKVKGRMHTPIACPVESVKFPPELHPGAEEIPAMTTPAERRAYYQLAKDQAPLGAVIELGTWLGAATIYIAAGVRDAGVAGPMHSYDRFRWLSIHEYKAGHPLNCDMMTQVQRNLGPLVELVKLHKGEIKAAKWTCKPIGLLVADGPKRCDEVARTLAIFGPSLVVGSCTAWQDFAYFPAYDLPVCFELLERAGCLSFVRGVFPGTTGIFRVERAIRREDVRRLELAQIDTAQILPTWQKWRDRLPDEMRPRFMCGAAMFLHDRGAQPQAVALFKSLLAEHREDIAAKWQYLKEKRPVMAAKYRDFVKAVDHAHA
jgi:hypothetical protein